MERKKKVKNWSIRIILFVMSGIWFQVSFSSEIHVFNPDLSTEIETHGNWTGKERSITPTIPIKAYTDGYSLLIQNQSPNSDITIRILNENGAVVFQDEIPAIETTNILIPIDTLSDGIYTLELTNKWGNYLYGTFVREEYFNNF